jgi:hypothetical protein
LRRGDSGDGFEQVGDLRACEREVAVPPARDRRDQSAFDEPREMVARRRRSDARFGGEHARRQ